MKKAAIIGATTWGSTLGKMLATRGVEVTLWARTEAEAEALKSKEQNLPQLAEKSSCFSITTGIDKVLDSAEVVFYAVPSQRLRQNVRLTAPFLGNSMILVSAAKGLEAESGKRMSEVMGEEVPFVLKERICALSGPNLSREINQGLPATSVVASRNIGVAKQVQGLLDCPDFSVYVSDDIVGVELCGALKNVIALGAGMLDGLGLGNNAKAAFITLGWNEVVKLGLALGAKISTFYGIAGLGDLIATGNSPLSRNYSVGYEMGKGKPLSEVRASMTQVVEGIDTTIAAYRLVSKLRLEAPIIDLIYGVLFESLAPAEIAKRFKDGLKPDEVL
jgi:glycerol-3-phosphate dehydrogenase (NAD(P)+)